MKFKIGDVIKSLDTTSKFNEVGEIVDTHKSKQMVLVKLKNGGGHYGNGYAEGGNRKTNDYWFFHIDRIQLVESLNAEDLLKRYDEEV